MSTLKETLKIKTIEELELDIVDRNKKNDLIMVSFTKNNNLSNQEIREANGTILTKNNEIVHHCFSMTYDNYNTEEVQELIKNTNNDNIHLQKFYEGSLIRVYYYNGKWNLGTSRKINARNNYWTSKKCFNTLFEEVLNNRYNKTIDDFYNVLDKEYCYTFILQHPENKMILKHRYNIIFVNKVSLNTLEEFLEAEELLNIVSMSEILNVKLEDLIKELEDEECDINNNYLCLLRHNNSYYRIKLLNKKYREAQELKNNEQHIEMKYIELIQNDMTEQMDRLKELFSENKKTFMYIDYKYKRVIKLIHRDYFNKYINKLDNIEYNKHYERTLTQLHAIYLKTRQPVTYETVENKLKELKPKAIAYILELKY